MKINIKKILVSLLVIAGFVFYAVYQRYSVGQQPMTAVIPNNTVAVQAATDTIPSTTQSTAGSLPPTDSTQALPDNIITNGDQYYGEDDNEYDDEGEGFTSQQTAISSSSQTGTNANPAASGSSSSVTSTTSGSSSSTTSTTAAPAAVTVTNALYKDGQFDGNAADAYYGLVQVRAIIQGGKLADVQFLSFPSDRNTSVRINNYAMPILKSEAIQVQSAKVNIVTGATNSSRAFVNSLSNALSQAQV